MQVKQKNNKIKPQQSTDHVLMVAPAVFFTNPETVRTNVYQTEDGTDPLSLLSAAKIEQQNFVKILRQNGLRVTLLPGSDACPDHVFPDWASTHNLEEEKGFILYAMYAVNRREEKTAEVLAFLKKHYRLIYDFTPYEDQGLALESTASICLDRVHKIAYAALSSRTSADLATLWAEKMGYELLTFRTKGHTGQPIYHTDLVMWVGTKIAAVCLDVILPEDRKQVLAALEKHHQVMLFSAQQLRQFCGNMLEARTIEGEHVLVMSSSAFQALTKAQKATLNMFYAKLIYCPIPTIEKYGGGSARCLVTELF